ncbi:MAG: TolC family protein [Woeseiaceae bacterium]
MFSKTPKALLIVPLLLVTPLSFAQQWTLESSVLQAISVAPELKKSTAEIGERREDVTLSSMWPDPSIEFRVDNKLGKDDSSGGYELTDVTISQAIPFSRTKYQQSVANANLKASEFSQVHLSLLLQNRVSKIFHQFQFASAQLSLAEKRLQLADELRKKTRRNTKSAIVRYLTPLEKMRLTIIREEANQAASNAEGKYHEALNEFTKLLGVEAEKVTTIPALQPITTLPDVNQLLTLQDAHPQLSSQQQQLVAANHAVGVARSSQMEDPTISLSHSQENFIGGRDDVFGIMFKVQIPLHSRTSTAVSKANYRVSQQNIELQRLKRELQINLRRSVTHLGHVVKQATTYQQKVLRPANKMLDLTNKSFTSGELNILSLIDANNTYFEARLRYLELLFQARAELADVKLFAGQMISGSNTQNVLLNIGEL